MRAAMLALAAALPALVFPATAAAHVRSGKSAVDYRATVSNVPAGVKLRVYPADLAIGLTAAPGHRVVVLGYVGEPAIRVDASGVQVNRTSLTIRGNGLLKKATGPATVKWASISSRPRAVWHDARLRGLPAGVMHGRWTVPLLVDGNRASIGGELVRAPKPAIWPWLVLAGLTAAAVAYVLRRHDRSLLRAAATALGLVAAAATVVTSADFAFASSASQGSWFEAANEVVFVLVGLAFVIWGSGDTKALAGGALGLLALAAGLSKFPALLHGIVLSALPGGVSRAAVALAICAGLGAVVLGLVVFFDVLEHYEEPEPVGGTIRSGPSNSR
jgi:hypothetical protein